MATAESVKNKIQGLINIVNEKTGNNASDLTAAINSINIEDVSSEVDAYSSLNDEFESLINGLPDQLCNGTILSLEGSLEVAAYYTSGQWGDLHLEREVGDIARNPIYIAAPKGSIVVITPWTNNDNNSHGVTKCFGSMECGAFVIYEDDFEIMAGM